MNGNMAFLCVKNCGQVPIHAGIGFEVMSVPTITCGVLLG